MTPIHHHFELIGWPETTVIIRFWLIAATCVAAAVGIFIADFTASCRFDESAMVYGVAVAGAAAARHCTAAASSWCSWTTIRPMPSWHLPHRSVPSCFPAPGAPRSLSCCATSTWSCPPLVPEHHRLFTAARDAGVEIVSELELAYRWGSSALAGRGR